jgi:hypothetical protein
VTVDILLLILDNLPVSFDLGLRGCLYPLARGHLELRMSNALSIFRINFTVGSLFLNCVSFIETSRNSITFATDELRVRATYRTFILCS